ncbi:PAS domain S-box-containing protein/diguanylate cyclase (GGDEF)-like protein [Halanaerobium saccharolyticum]|uniref:PAS domain S-box-containing protein/diguanylate cyclase (GGDEF)-like protein n=1 Tax=Halanaerobium saccharolyticum TaxID=43595 RepID=A0A4R6LTV0_9FIRM|nr:diguanylate cyclase [Halanaerobium saccharolyticum]TDO92068.1 PAS domain S-box-containing protein/diguanylate cyclase (GGDEF)-like protein [Halanaerobium saccharolyticum]
MAFDTYLETGFTYIYLAGLIMFWLGFRFLFHKEKKEYLLYFSYFWTFAIAATAADILYFHFQNNFFVLLNSIMHLLEAVFLVKAVYKYFNQKTADIWYSFLKALVLLSVLGFLFRNQLFILAPTLVYLSFAFIKSGILFYKLAFNQVSTFTAAVSSLFGLNLLAAPYLMRFNWFNRYGIFLKGLLGLLFGISLFAVYYEDLQYKLKIREKQYQKLFDQSPAGMLLLDKKGKIIQVNNSICDYTGYSKEELEGHSMFENLVPAKFKIRARQKIGDILENQDQEYIMETYDKFNNKKFFLMKETKFVLPDYTNCVLSMRIDYTDYKKQQQEIQYLSYHDNLTDLYNRTFMEEEMKRLDSSRRLPISIIMIDVNGLKLFNDTYGHQKGDQLLIRTSEILKDSTRSEDIVARWAGDEFVILLPGTNKKEMEKIIRRIENNCIKTEDEETVISLAVGAAVKEKCEENIFNVFDQADKEMYKQKMSKSREAKKKLVENILVNLENKSTENKDHLQRMKRTAAEFADYLDLKKDEKERLKILAELHDLGKINIAEEVLKKEESLNIKEWEKIKEHSDQGYKIAAASKEFAFIAKEILHHHERWDGNGYPAALKKEEIPLLARIISLIDAYDVMRNKNIYKNKMTKKEAVRELQSCSGSQFDPELTDKFIDFIS